MQVRIQKISLCVAEFDELDEQLVNDDKSLPPAHTAPETNITMHPDRQRKKLLSEMMLR